VNEHTDDDDDVSHCLVTEQVQQQLDRPVDRPAPGSHGESVCVIGFINTYDSQSYDTNGESEATDGSLANAMGEVRHACMYVTYVVAIGSMNQI
jgi:hypothetical protein